MTGEICGTGAYVPDCTMDNHDIAKLVDTSDAWIRERTGVVRRHIVREETTVSMACEAGRRALEDAGIEAGELDLILVSTISSNVILPCAACEVQRELGAVNAVCFDLNAACTGFVLAYNTAMAYLTAGVYRTILVIGSESLSNLTNWQDRGTCILFGDGAGAVVMRACEGESRIPVTHSDGNRGEALRCRSPYSGSPALSAKEQMLHSERCDSYDEEGTHAGIAKDVSGLSAECYMQMDGKAVFTFAVRKVPEVITEVLERNMWKKEEIRYYILHQANKRIVEAVAGRLEEPMEKFPMNLQEYGNTSSASIPILLDELNRAGRLAEGDKIILAGFGAGLTWGASAVEWKKQQSK